MDANLPGTLNDAQTSQLVDLATALNPEQSLWASGFLAGRSGTLFTGSPGAAPAAPVAAPAAAAPAMPVQILYGTESGNCETLADQTKRRLASEGYAPTIKNFADIKPADLAKMSHVLIIVSTWGEGDPPDSMTDFHTAFMGDACPECPDMKFSVCALGDSSYADFCEIGKQVDSQLEKKGATRLAARQDCDVDFDDSFAAWLEANLTLLAADRPAAPAPVAAAPVAAAPAAGIAAAPAVAEPTPSSTYNKRNPFPATLTESILLNGEGSAKETLHLEISLAGSDLAYQPGDALAVIPENADDVVKAVLAAAGLKAGAKVKTDDGDAKLGDLLRTKLDCTAISKSVIKKYNGLAKSKKLDKMLDDRDALKDYVWGRQLVDLLTDYPVKKLKAADLVSVLRKLPPRLYSIASSMRAHPDEVHLTIAAVRYHSHGQDRKGVASTYFADDLKTGDKVLVYLHHNKNFRLPANPDTPVIMVGPGTGVAPFRAFLEERSAVNAKGPNWMFFGDQHYSTDFLYQLEFQEWLKTGVLDRLDVAFSRDQAEKIYVQHRMLEHAEEIFAWLQNGAHFYVCGDAERMAGDVHEALIQIISDHGGRNRASAEAYLAKLKKDRRYQRDVY